MQMWFISEWCINTPVFLHICLYLPAQLGKCHFDDSLMLTFCRILSLGNGAKGTAYVAVSRLNHKYWLKMNKTISPGEMWWHSDGYDMKYSPRNIHTILLFLIPFTFCHHIFSNLLQSCSLKYPWDNLGDMGNVCTLLTISQHHK